MGIFEYAFMQRALIVFIPVALCAALLGVSLILKRYSMIGDGLSHVGFGALAISKNKKILLYICTHIAGKRRKKKKEIEKPDMIRTSLIKKWFFKKFGKKNILAKHIEKCISKYDENEHKDNTKEMKKNLKQSKIDKKKKLDKQFKHMIKMSKNEEFEMRNGRKGSY